MEKSKREKKRYVRELIIMAIILAVVALTVSYAAVNATLDIAGVSAVRVANWNIKFDEASVVNQIGTAEIIYSPKIRGTNIHYEVRLNEVGDSVTIKAVVKNSGNMDAELESYDFFGVPSEYEDNISYKVTDEKGDKLSEGLFLPSSETEAAKRYMTIYITISYDKLIYSNNDENYKVFDLGLGLNFVQAL